MPIDPEMPVPAPDPVPPLAPAGPEDAVVPSAEAAAAGLAAVGAVHAAATASHGHHGPFHTHCENCGAKLEGPWCHRCGQHDFEFHRSFWHVFLEALETIFHFEGKFFRNIVTLLFQPGRLSADFNAGKRAAQMPPFRLYIFVSFVFFLLIFLNQDDPGFIRDTEGPHQGLSIAGKPVVAGQFWQAAWAEAAREMKPEDWQNAEKVARTIEQAAARAEKSAAAPAISVGAGPGLVQQLQAAAAAAKAEAERKSGGRVPAQTGSKSELDRYLNELGRRAFEPENRARLTESFKRHLPHLLMVCLPFFALFTRVLFRKSGQVYLQHLVVALHFHTFIYIWVLCRNGWAGLADLPGWGLRGWVMFACNLWLFAYPVLMLRRLFGNSWLKTAIKAFVLAFVYSVMLGLGFSITAVLLFVNL